jgi:hypothetical protein
VARKKGFFPQKTIIQVLVGFSVFQVGFSTYLLTLENSTAFENLIQASVPRFYIGGPIIFLLSFQTIVQLPQVENLFSPLLSSLPFFHLQVFYYLELRL